MSFILLYIDPGTGSLFYQAFLSACLTGIIFFKSIKQYLFNLLGIGKKETTNGDENKNDEIISKE